MSRFRTLAAAVLVLPLGLAPALAQTAWVEVEDDDALVEGFTMTVDDLDDKDVYGPGGEQIGEVEEVLAGPDGVPAAIALETEGFLGTGVGGEDVVVPLDQLTQEGGRLVAPITEAYLETLETWDD
jgi:hypothetical protein